MKTRLSISFFLITCLTTFAQTCAITYQGRLSDSNNAANGLYDLELAVFATPTAGSPLGTAVEVDNVVVTNGLFTVTFDPGASVWDGNERWLEIRVRPGAGKDPYTFLTPRQPITSAPYAVRAANFNGLITGAQLPASVPRLDIANTFSNPANQFTGSFSGNAAGMSNIALFSALNAGGFFNWGNFTSNDTVALGGSPDVGVALDLNRDGVQDLAVVHNSAGSVQFLTNNGRGRLSFHSAITGLSSPIGAGAADMNADGWTDLVLGVAGGSATTVYTNNQAGGFAIASSSSGGTRPAIADFNGDGRPDFAGVDGVNSLVYIRTNAGAGVVFSASFVSTPSAPSLVVADDVNGDGAPDVVAVLANSFLVLTNNGSGVFSTASTPTSSGSTPSIAAGDLNRDGAVDLVLAKNTANAVAIFTNSGGGNFAFATNYNFGSGPQSVAVADVNGDGSPDLMAGHLTSGLVEVATNDTAGRFVEADIERLGSAVRTVIVAELNRDGAPDLITLNSGGNSATVLLNTPRVAGADNLPHGDTEIVFSPEQIISTSGFDIGRGAGFADLYSVPISSSNVAVFNLPLQLPASLNGTPQKLKRLKIHYQIGPTANAFIYDTSVLVVRDDFLLGFPISDTTARTNRTPSYYFLTNATPALITNTMSLTWRVAYPVGYGSTNFVRIGTVSVTVGK